MELKTDSSHEMINLDGLNLSDSKKINVNLGSTDLELFVMSGSKKKLNTEVNNMINDNDSNIINDNERVRY